MLRWKPGHDAVKPRLRGWLHAGIAPVVRGWFITPAFGQLLRLRAGCSRPSRSLVDPGK